MVILQTWFNNKNEIKLKLEEISVILMHEVCITQLVGPKYRILWLEDLWKASDIPSALHWGAELQTAAGQKPQMSQSPTYKFLPKYAFPRQNKSKMVLFLSSVFPLSSNSPGKGSMIKRKCSFLVFSKFKLCSSENNARTVLKLAETLSYLLQLRANAKNCNAVIIRISSRLKSDPHTSKTKDWVVTYQPHFIVSYFLYD